MLNLRRVVLSKGEEKALRLLSEATEPLHISDFAEKTRQHRLDRLRMLTNFAEMGLVLVISRPRPLSKKAYDKLYSISPNGRAALIEIGKIAAAQRRLEALLNNEVSSDIPA